MVDNILHWQEPISRSTQACNSTLSHGIFADWSLFSLPIEVQSSDVNQFLMIGHGTPTRVSFQGNSIKIYIGIRTRRDRNIVELYAPTRQFLPLDKSLSTG